MSASYKYNLKPSLSETFEGIIWKVETDDTNSIIAIETRDIPGRRTHFSAFNYTTGECLFKEATVEDGWFWSIDRVYSGLVFLHSYVNESNPEHKGMIALNKGGEVQWQQFHKTLYDVSDKGLIVYNPKIQPKLFELIAADTGTTITTKVQEYLPLTRDILIPDVMNDVSFIQRLLPQNLVGPVLYTEFNNKLFLAFHLQTGTSYLQQLAVYHHESLLLQDNLSTDIQKMNPEAFFIQHGHLFYIRNNKREFVSYLV